MHTARTLSLLIIALILIVLGDKTIFNKVKEEPQAKKESDKTPTLTPTPIPTNTPTFTPTSKPQKPTAPRETQGTTLDDFIYPNSKRTESQTNHVTLESPDDPSVITNWYKNKIKEKGMNATSYVQTSTNGNILNRLVGARSGLKVDIEIKKKSTDSVSTINVILK